MCSASEGREDAEAVGVKGASRASIFSDQLKSAVRCAWKVYSGTAYPHDCLQQNEYEGEGEGEDA